MNSSGELNDGVVSVVTAADSKYAPHAAAMLNSLLQSDRGSKFHIYFLHRQEGPRDHLEKIGALCEQLGARFTAVEVDPGLVATWPENSRYGEEAWYRLRLPSLLPNLPKVLWLDADMLVLSSVLPLWNMAMDGFSVAAVPNALTGAEALLPKKLELGDDALYFNSGVMLLDLDQLRRERAEESFDRAIEKIGPYLQYPDQDVLNSVFHQRYKKIPLKWNVMSGVFLAPGANVMTHGWETVISARKAPAIVHFTGNSFKPWERDNARHPFRESYLVNRRDAGWGAPEIKSVGIRRRILRALPMSCWLALSRLRQGNLQEVYWIFKVALLERLSP